MKEYLFALLINVCLFESNYVLAQSYGWQKVLPGYVKALAPGPDGNHYAMAGKDLYRSEDGGKSWERIGTPIPSESFTGEDIDFRANGDLLVATGISVFSTSDEGETWTTPAHLLPPWNYADESPKDAVIIISASGAVFLGASYRDHVDAASAKNDIRAIGGGLYRSRDSGSTWDEVISASTASDFYQVTEDDVGRLYAGSEIGLFMSDDDGDSWKLSPDLGTNVTDNVAHSSGSLFAASARGRFRTDDRGQTWTELGSFDHHDGFLIVSYDGDLVSTKGGLIEFGADFGQLFRSSDDGATWEEMTTWTELRRWLSDFLIVGTLYQAPDDALLLATIYGLFREGRDAPVDYLEGFLLEADSLALIALYEALDGPDWRRNGRWFEGPAWSWEGVNIENNRVVLLDLRHNRVKGAIPSAIGQLTGLRHFSLDDNDITEIPPEIGRLNNLKSLGLQNNEIGEIPPEIGNLDSLTGLWLMRNQLLTVPAEIGQLSSLRGLDISYNRINSLPVWQGQLFNLTSLDLSNNHLRFIPAQIGQLHRLERLYLNDNPLYGRLPFFLTYLPNLEFLDLRDTRYCLPSDVAYKTWLSGIERASVDLPVCTDYHSTHIVPYIRNYPNPFPLSTQIDFVLIEDGPVTLRVFDMMGREIATLIDGPMPAGEHAVAFNAYGLAGGTYVYRLETQGNREARLLTLIK